VRFDEASGIHNMWRVDVHSCEPSVTKEQSVEFSRHIACLPGRAVVACHLPRTKVGNLWLTDYHQEHFRADLATVIAASGCGPLLPGMEVVTDWQLGKRVRGLSCTGIDIEAEVRYYGLAGGTAKDGDDGCEDLPFGSQHYSEGILMIKDGETFVPLGDKALFKLPPMMDTTEGGLILADSAKKREAKWECIAVGPDADPKYVGMFGIVHTGGMQYVVTDDGCEYAIGRTKDSEQGDSPIYCFVN
jgi:co-chaperonin GroES (HSP10)